MGRRLKGGEFIELIGDLGSGKTVFVRGLAKGAGSKDAVASPSFTVAREYRAKNFTIHHYDLYRLEETGVVGQELAESIEDAKVTVVIEWAALASALLPEDRLSVHFQVVADEKRILKLSAGSKHKKLIENSK